MFNDLIMSGSELKSKLASIKTAAAGTDLRKLPLATRYFEKRITFEVERTMYDLVKDHIQTEITCELSKHGGTAQLTADYDDVSYQVSARVYPLGDKWICFIVFQPAFAGVMLLAGSGDVLSDALFTEASEMSQPVVAPRSDKRYSIYYDEHLSEPLIWPDGSHASSHSRKSVKGFCQQYLKKKGAELYVWDARRSQVV